MATTLWDKPHWSGPAKQDPIMLALNKEILRLTTLRDRYVIDRAERLMAGKALEDKT